MNDRKTPNRDSPLTAPPASDAQASAPFAADSRASAEPAAEAPPPGTDNPGATRILFVSGLSGAGKSTALQTLEDMGWEVVDNLPLALLDRLVPSQGAGPPPIGGRPLAIGIDSRTRGFDAAAIAARAASLCAQGYDAEVLFLQCSEGELLRRFSETRRRHPLALDRPAADGIAHEHALLAPLRQAAEVVIDTSATSSQDLRLDLRARFGPPGRGAGAMTVTILSFGYAQGLPREADLVFDMRFLRNPHWDPALRHLTGADPAIGAFIAQDPAFAPAMAQIEALLLLLLPRYQAEGKAYLTVAIGCTGGRHRSVYCAHLLAQRLVDQGQAAMVRDRDLQARDSV